MPTPKAVVPPRATAWAFYTCPCLAGRQAENGVLGNPRHSMKIMTKLVTKLTKLEARLDAIEALITEFIAAQAAPQGEAKPLGWRDGRPFLLQGNVRQKGL